MTRQDQCPKCDSTRVIDDVQVVDGTLQESLKAQVHSRPQAKLFKGTVGVRMKARVCGACGFTELYADNPARLLEAHKQGR